MYRQRVNKHNNDRADNHKTGILYSYCAQEPLVKKHSLRCGASRVGWSRSCRGNTAHDCGLGHMACGRYFCRNVALHIGSARSIYIGTWTI